MSGLRWLISDESSRSRLLEIASRLESGKRGAEIAAEPDCNATAVVAAVVLAGLSPDGPPLIQNSPRRPKLKTSASEPALAELFPNSLKTARLALSAGLLQILDFWDESHEAAQLADDLGERLDSAYWHGIVHRREPDPGNAGYWFRRVGPHPVFDTLAKTVLTWPKIQDELGPKTRLLRTGSWDPQAFIDFCRAGSAVEPLARQIQATEMLILLDNTLEAVL